MPNIFPSISKYTHDIQDNTKYQAAAGQAPAQGRARDGLGYILDIFAYIWIWLGSTWICLDILDISWIYLDILNICWCIVWYIFWYMFDILLWRSFRGGRSQPSLFDKDKKDNATYFAPSLRDSSSATIVNSSVAMYSSYSLCKLSS